MAPRPQIRLFTPHRDNLTTRLTMTSTVTLLFLDLPDQVCVDDRLPVSSTTNQHPVIDLPVPPQTTTISNVPLAALLDASFLSANVGAAALGASLETALAAHAVSHGDPGNHKISDADDVAKHVRLTLLPKQCIVSVPHDRVSMFGLQMSKAPRHARAHGLPPATAISYASQGGLLKRARAALNRTLFDKQHDNDNEQQHNTGRSTSMGETQKENVGLQQQQQQQEPYTGCAYLSCGRALVQLPPGVDDDKNSGNVSVSQRVIEPVISHALYKPCDMPIIDHCLTTSSVENALALIDFIQYACHHDNATTAMNNNIRNANDSNDTPTMTIKCPSTFIDYGDLKGDGNNDNINTTSIAQPNTEETEKKKNVRVRRVRYSGFCNSGLATAAIHCARDAVNQGKCRWATVFATAPHAHAVWKGSSARSGKPGFSIDAAELFIVSKTQVVAAQLRPPCDAV